MFHNNVKILLRFHLVLSSFSFHLFFHFFDFINIKASIVIVYFLYFYVRFLVLIFLFVFAIANNNPSVNYKLRLQFWFQFDWLEQSKVYNITSTNCNVSISSVLTNSRAIFRSKNINRKNHIHKEPELALNGF